MNHWFVDSFIRCFIDLLNGWTIGSVICWFIASLVHRSNYSFFIDELIHWNTLNHWWFIGSLNLPLVGSLIHWFLDSVIDCFIDSLIRWLIDSLDRSVSGPLTHWLVASLSHWAVEPLAHSSLIHWIRSLIHWFMRSLVHCFIASFIQFCSPCFMSSHWHLSNPWPIPWHTSQHQHPTALHRKSFHIGHWFPIDMSGFRICSRVPPWRVPVTTW